MFYNIFYKKTSADLNISSIFSWCFAGICLYLRKKFKKTIAQDDAL